MPKTPPLIVPIHVDTTAFVESIQRIRAMYDERIREAFERAARAFAELGEFFAAHPEFLDPSRIDQIEVVHIDLEACWRCSVPVPRDDDLGLCQGCIGVLANL